MDDEAGQLILSPQPSDRKQSFKILYALEAALKSELSKNLTLISERESLLQLFKRRNDRVNLLESRIEHMKTLEVQMKKYNATKITVFLDNKEEKALAYKEYSKSIETDLKDAHTSIAALRAKIKALESEPNNGEGTELKTLKLENKKVKHAYKTLKSEKEAQISAKEKQIEDLAAEKDDLKSEVKKLKHAFKTLKSEKEAQISAKENEIEALAAEKDFVWNQLKVMESQHVATIKSKNSELEKSSEAVMLLKKNVAELEASISKLKEEIAASELKEETAASISKKDEVISRLNGEVEDLKKKLKGKDQMISGLHADVAKFAARAGPLLNPVDSGTSRILSGKKRPRETVLRARPSPSLSVSGNHQHSMRSQGSACTSTAETPRLFSSSFKVPKLKNTILPPSGPTKSTLAK